jgi:sugar transferase (PEP-CTERM system associated)
MMLRVFRHFVPIPKIFLILFEILIISVAWYFFLLNDAPLQSTFGSMVRSPTLALSILAVLAMVVTGSYHNKAFLNYRIMVVGISASFVLIAIVTYIAAPLWKDLFVESASLSTIYLKAGLSWLVCVLITRAAFLILSDMNLFKTRILVLGTGNKAARIASLVATYQNRHFIPAAYLHTCDDPIYLREPPIDIDTAKDDMTFVARLGRECRASEIVVATDDRRGLPVRQLLHCRLAGMRVIDYLDFIERETKTVDLAALQPGWLVYCDGFRCGRLSRVSKRCFDILLSAAILVFTLPVILMTSLLIKLESRGPLIYRQERVGLGGRYFVLLKFRSMRADAESDGTPRWAAGNDSRVTRIGRIIRKVRIDELPQLFNVLRGDMSFVGPRPERPVFVEEFVQRIPFFAERHCVRPGITGWAQINYHYGAGFEDACNKLSYDLYYVKNHGFFLDLVIILQTVRVILWAEGSR